MINITLPDEKSNYVHRIGRVGRAERMGLAISLVSTVPEKVATITADSAAPKVLQFDGVLFILRYGIMANGAKLVDAIVSTLI